ncbi:MAG: triose-phosphate isomerase [Candidatus Saccharibacteria bacterium]|nr:triose-phosphate isomerase [Candidatus Saccharibacteria bacterium]
MTKTLIVGNWKMNLNVHQASLYVHELSSEINHHDDVDVVLAPSFIALQTLSLQVKKHHLSLAAQNCYWRDDGAFTGEVSATQLRGLVNYVIIGHSERRHKFGETNKEIRAKVQAVLRNGLIPILCVGETADERANGETKHVLHDQVSGGLANVASDEIHKVVIAYEPVWAIGTGENALPKDVESAEETIRHQVESLYGHKAATGTKLLYGGSVNSDNASDYLALKGIDGFLVGGASLHVQQFSSIISKAHQLKGKKS